MRVTTTTICGSDLPRSRDSIAAQRSFSGQALTKGDDGELPDERPSPSLWLLGAGKRWHARRVYNYAHDRTKRLVGDRRIFESDEQSEIRERRFSSNLNTVTPGNFYELAQMNETAIWQDGPQHEDLTGWSIHQLLEPSYHPCRAITARRDT